MTIKRSGSGYKLYSKKTGKPLSKKTKTKAAALKQERAIQIAKHARGR